MSAPPQAGTSAQRALSVRVLATAIMLYPLVAIFSPKALVILLIATSLALLFDGRNRANPFAVLPRGVLAFLAALAVWTVAALWWSPLPLRGLDLWARVIGIGLCGPHAGEMISEGVLALEMGAVAYDIETMIHPHPTLSEMIGEAAGMVSS